MKARMRTRYTFHDTDGNFIGWGDDEKWAEGVRQAWGDEAVEKQERVMFVGTRKKGAMK